MKRITQWIVTSSICLLIAFNLQANPKAEISQSSFDFGFAPQESKLSHKYWIRSTGSEDLKITKVVPGCGCTKAPLEKDIVSSGDSTWLEIVFSSKKYNSKITKKPKFFTNAKTDAEQVSFTAEIVTPTTVTYPLVISPFKVNLIKQDIQTDLHLAKSTNSNILNADQGTIEITNSSDKELSITIIDFDYENFAITFPHTIKAGEAVKGYISVRDSSTDKALYKSLTIEVNDENKTRFTIPVVQHSKVISQK